ncbi:MAG TPA: hypothetical protein VFL30_05065 [Rhodanobacteraceae bacterium]|nr:hypothetical protein [Rhodanobacteraceae bacterium]
MAEPKRLTDKQILSPTQTAVALGLITEMDFLRLKTIARLYARGLPADVGWDDLLQEALTRVIVGTRNTPDGVPTVAFVAGIIRSLRSDHRRRAQHTSQLTPAHTDRDDGTALTDAVSDPERAVTARQELEAIERLFGDDRAVLQIIACLGRGLSADQICTVLRMSKTEYDSARKRMRRRLLREGLTCAV